MLDEKDRYFLNALSLRLGIEKVRDSTSRCKCIACGDGNGKKKRMYFVMKGSSLLVYCHNCGYSASLKNFIKAYAPDMYEEYTLYGFKKLPPSVNAEEIKSLLVPNKLYCTNEELFSVTSSFSELELKDPHRRYVEHRQLPFSKVRFCSNFYSLTKKLTSEETYSQYPFPCIIIPFFRADNQIKILQARFFDSKIKPKYLTLKLDPEEKKIYNADFVDYTKRINILEGPIDSMFCPNAIAMAGSDGTPEREGDYCWVYDNEPRNAEICTKILQKIKQGRPVVIWKRSDKFKDINEAIVKKIVTKEEISVIFNQRIKKRLQAELEFAKWRL